jgi:hypothetical protein
LPYKTGFFTWLNLLNMCVCVVYVFF